MVDQIETELGGTLANLGRVEKQAAVRMLDERGAFMLRRAIEDVAAMMEVSRITIYNYLNAIRKD
jgi:predicted transcriptional regulator YheO